MLRVLLTVLVSMMAFGCGPRYADFFPCHDDGSSKPKVVLIPIKDCSNASLPWDSSESMSLAINYDIMCRGELFLFSQYEVQKNLNQMGPIDFCTDEETLSKQFCEADFIVLLELLEQTPAPFTQTCAPANSIVLKYPCDTKYTMKMRVKIIDARPRCPRIALQEVIVHNYLMPRSCLGAGLESSEDSPVWKAQQRMSVSVSQRLEQVIESAY
jgi:hypothetical protein